MPDLFGSDVPVFSKNPRQPNQVISAVSRFIAAYFSVDPAIFSVLSFYYGRYSPVVPNQKPLE